MSTFDTHKPGDDEAILRTRFIAPPADKLAALAARLPADIAEALALTPYHGRDRESGRPARRVTRTLTWDLTRPMHR